MSKFFSRPVEIEATQWFKNGDHPEDDVYRVFEDTGLIPTKPREGDVVRYYRTPDLDGQNVCGYCGKIMHVHGWVETLEGGHIACPGDWIVTGLEGEYYPVKPSIFAKKNCPLTEVIIDQDQCSIKYLTLK